MAESAIAYLTRVTSEIDGLPGSFPGPPRAQPRSPGDTQGYLMLARLFDDGSRLAVSLYVDTSGPVPVWLRYRIHYMDAGDRCIFRYDNSAHHASLSTFPHHKHEGWDERVVESGPIELIDVLEEIREHVGATT